MRQRNQLEALQIEPILISADDPTTNRRFRERMGITFPLLSDVHHEVADRYGVPISRRHWNSRHYPDGFIQPALFVYQGEKPLFEWITRPRLTNLYGAARRPEPESVIAAIREQLGRPKR